MTPPPLAGHKGFAKCENYVKFMPWLSHWPDLNLLALTEVWSCVLDNTLHYDYNKHIKLQ